MFCIIIPRPKSTVTNLEQGHEDEEEAQERVFKCTIRRPIAHEQFVSSVFQCRVGDVIIYEDGEEISNNDSTEPLGICFLASLYEMEWKN